MSFDAAGKNLAQVSYVLLILLGLFLFGKSLYELKHKEFNVSETELSQNSNIKQIMLTAFITGLVPCPGAALILIFTITRQIFFSGILAMFCITLGMGVTTTLFALMAIASRKTLSRLTARRQKLFAISHSLLSILGAVVITFIGALLFIG